MISDMQKKMVMQELEEANALLSKDVNVTAITYSDFMQYALPVLATIQDGSFNPQNWLRIAGHPLNELSVVDNVSGEEKYRIPSMLAHSDLQAVEEYKLSQVADHAATIRSEAPGLADQQLYDHLSLLSTDEEDNLAYRQRVIVALNKVFGDHDLPLIESNQVAETKPVQDEPVFLGYDLA